MTRQGRLRSQCFPGKQSQFLAPWPGLGRDQSPRSCLQTHCSQAVGAAGSEVTQGDNNISCRKDSTYRVPQGDLRWAFTAVLFPSESIENNNPTAKHKSHCKTWWMVTCGALGAGLLFNSRTSTVHDSQTRALQPTVAVGLCCPTHSPKAAEIRPLRIPSHPSSGHTLNDLRPDRPQCCTAAPAQHRAGCTAGAAPQAEGSRKTLIFTNQLLFCHKQCQKLTEEPRYLTFWQ